MSDTTSARPPRSAQRATSNVRCEFRRGIAILALTATTLPGCPAKLTAQVEIEQVGKGVVRIYALGNGNLVMGSGSGFVVNDQGYLVTNHHVVDGAKALKILTNPVADSLAATLLPPKDPFQYKEIIPGLSFP